jgi:hypothetical protein
MSISIKGQNIKDKVSPRWTWGPLRENMTKLNFDGIVGENHDTQVREEQLERIVIELLESIRNF